MAKVTRYEEDQVRTEIAPSPQMGRVDTGTEFAAGQLTNAIDSGVKAYGVFRAKKDEVEVDRTAQQYTRDINDLLYETESGYVNLQGQDAVENREAAMQRLSDLKKQYANQERSPRANAAFIRASDALENRARVVIDQHAQKGLEAYDAETRKTAAMQEIDNAFHYGTEGFLPWPGERQAKFYDGISRGRQAVRDTLVTQGLIDGSNLDDPNRVISEVEHQAIMKYDSTYALSAIQGASRAGYESAAVVHKGLNEFLTGKDALQADALLKSLKVKEEEEDWARVVTTASHEIIEREGVNTRADVIKAAMAIEDKKLSGAVLAEASRVFSMNKAAKEEAAAAAFDDATGFLELNPAVSVQTYIDDAPDKWNAMTDAMRAQIWRRIPVETDHFYYSDLKLMSPQELVEHPLEKIVGGLAPQERKEIINLRAGYLQELAKGAKTPKLTVEASVNASNATATREAVVLMMGAPESDWGKNTRATAESIMQLADYQARKRAKDLGVDVLPREEYRKVLNDIQKDFYRENKPWYQYFSKDTLKSLGPEKVEKARDVIFETGLDATPDMIYFASQNTAAEISRAKVQLEREHREVSVKNLNTLIQFYREGN